jgi:V/A-type H+-transporting ATPase subunit C
MWIYRQKQFFDCSKADIYDSIIPIRYRLKKREIDAMVEAERAEQIKDILAKSAYFTGPDPVVTLEDEISSNDVMDRVYRRACRRYPMSIAPVYQYLRDKLHEIDVLTTIIEGVRYRIPPRDIQESIVIL